MSGTVRLIHVGELIVAGCYVFRGVFRLICRTPPDEAGGGAAATGAPEAEGGERSVAWLWSTHALALDSDEEGFR